MAATPKPAAPPPFFERDVPFETMSGIPVKALYTEEDLPDDIDAAIGRPGEPPFTRGVYPSMYRGRLWTMRQFAGFGTAEETNARFRYLLAARAWRSTSSTTWNASSGTSRSATSASR
jgi:methylmalonyl-CoA mutase N-terminal domain/subunit